MAWSSNVTVLANVPFLITKVAVVTDDANATAVAHGGPTAEPDLVIPVLSSAADVGGVSISAKSTTTVTADPETSGDTFDIYCVWLNQASGGITA